MRLLQSIKQVVMFETCQACARPDKVKCIPTNIGATRAAPTAGYTTLVVGVEIWVALRVGFFLCVCVTISTPELLTLAQPITGCTLAIIGWDVKIFSHPPTILPNPSILQLKHPVSQATLSSEQHGEENVKLAYRGKS